LLPPNQISHIIGQAVNVHCWENSVKLRRAAETIKFRLLMEAGLTIQEFSDLIGRHQSTVSLVIGGRRISRPVVTELASVLREDPDELATYLLSDQNEVPK